MTRKFLTVAVLAVVSGSALFAAGCASDHADRPYGLTGDRAVNQSDDWRYTDQKGHYHPEWRAQDHPVR